MAWAAPPVANLDHLFGDHFERLLERDVPETAGYPSGSDGGRRDATGPRRRDVHRSAGPCCK